MDRLIGLSCSHFRQVVLPVVARKKGLEGYEQKDGSPKPRPPGPRVYEPVSLYFIPPLPCIQCTCLKAPGTFGIDNSRYRPRTSMDPNDIPMDEFGQRKEEPPASPPAPRSPPPSSPIKTQPIPSPQPSIQRRAESPAPFAHYATDDGGIGAAPGVKDMPPQPRVEQQDDDGGGCCKCVIM